MGNRIRRAVRSMRVRCPRRETIIGGEGRSGVGIGHTVGRRASMGGVGLMLGGIFQRDLAGVGWRVDHVAVGSTMAGS